MPQQCFSIGSAQHKHLLKYELSHDLQALRHQGLKVRLTEDVTNGFTFLDCYLSGYTRPQPMIYRQVAQATADLIINKWENFIVKDIIMKNFYYFDQDEKAVIFDYALKKLNQNWQNKEKNRLTIIHKLTECLGNNQKIVIEGFIRFRLKDYVNLLGDVAEQAVDDFLMDRECKEFIRLLQYFVEIQEPQMNLVHVVLGPGNTFQLYDKQHQAIDSDYLQDFMLDLTDHEINYEDLLISALITIAPREVKLHPGSSRQIAIFDTINSVFAGRVTECIGCQLCKQQ